jgi:bacillopeptidase F (M6 metalloprotease family)
MGTVMTTSYSYNDTWAATTATSPAIDLTGATNPLLTFRMFVDTEGGYDGANLEISNDNVHWSVVGNTLPAYGAMMIGNEGAWSGHQGGLGWQLVQADLTAYANTTIYLRFAFQSDNANNYGGVFIDDILIN